MIPQKIEKQKQFQLNTLLDLSANYMEFFDVSVLNNICSNCSEGIIKMYFSDEVVIRKSKFYQNKAEFGGSLYLKLAQEK